jgi:ankyrin repeat protein
MVTQRFRGPIKNGNKAIVVDLLNHKDVKVNHQSSDGDTALFWAIKNGYSSIVADIEKR